MSASAGFCAQGVQCCLARLHQSCMGAVHFLMHTAGCTPASHGQLLLEPWPVKRAVLLPALWHCAAKPLAHPVTQTCRHATKQLQLRACQQDSQAACTKGSGLQPFIHHALGIVSDLLHRTLTGSKSTAQTGRSQNPSSYAQGPGSTGWQGCSWGRAWPEAQLPPPGSS